MSKFSRFKQNAKYFWRGLQLVAVVYLVSVVVYFAYFHTVPNDSFSVRTNQNEFHELSVPTQYRPSFFYTKPAFEVYYPSFEAQDRPSYTLKKFDRKRYDKEKAIHDSRGEELAIRVRYIPDRRLGEGEIINRCNPYSETPGIRDWKFEKEIGRFNRYIDSQPGSAKDTHLYTTKDFIPALHCIRCIETKNCSLYAHTKKGIGYSAMFAEEIVLAEYEGIMEGIDRFFEEHTVSRRPVTE